MEYRSGSDSDFKNIETFVWQAIFPAFNHPDLSEEQTAENDAIVAQAQEACLEAVALDNKEIIIAYDRRERRLAGFVIADRASFTYPAVSWLIVSRKYWGKGVADELLRRGISWLGTHKPIKASVHYYLERALRFFARYGFENTGEPAGEHLIPRILLIREAGPLQVPETVEVPEQLEIIPPEIVREDEVHNPLEPEEEELMSSPEAVVTPVAENSIPDLFTVADADQASAEANEDEIATPEPIEKPYKSRYENIEFEIDYGEEDTPEGKDEPENNGEQNGLDFEFAFEEEPPAEEGVVEALLELEELIPETENISDQVDEQPAEEIIEDDGYQSSNVTVESEPEQPGVADERSFTEETDAQSKPGLSIEELRAAFQAHFLSMASDLFGERSGNSYWEQLLTSDFKEIAERSLSQLANSSADQEDRLKTIFADLTEYFIVSETDEEHGEVFPQRLLRHQTQEANQIDLFTLINDYLELGNEQERVDTDFITISPKRLKNATKSFLLARPGERIYFLIDQSLLGNLKNGFAFTDQAFYWKAMLQPNHVAYYNELEEVRMNKGAVQINGHFFDTGKRKLNLKIVLLLKRLARL
ncbi:hypothetical protein CEQ90_10545 [Lewinellaceae bacterium SD302]|nr:hypothetical protein CEQ90_10545 [Lewinellaceae bacterium SD302]